MLWALLDNAVKYSPTGSPGTVRIRPDGPGELLVAVSDAGTGMDTETVANALDQFFRSTQARKLAPDGSGMGLYAAYGLMRADDTAHSRGVGRWGLSVGIVKEGGAATALLASSEIDPSGSAR